MIVTEVDRVPLKNTYTLLAKTKLDGDLSRMLSRAMTAHRMHGPNSREFFAAPAILCPDLGRIYSDRFEPERRWLDGDRPNRTIA